MGTFTDSSIKQLVSECIDDGNLHKLLRLPNTLDDFPEACIIQSVEYIIKCEEDRIEKALSDVSETELAQSTPWRKEDIESPHSAKKCFALNMMLSQKFSPQFLQEAARGMSFDCVLIITKYLQFLLSWSPPVPEENPCLPPLEQVIDWLNALVDSHFQQLKLAEDARELIGSLQEKITVMTQWQSESKALLGTLAEVRRQFEEQQRSNQKMGDYCIEVISF
ncbi:nucleolar protein 11-like [Elysia marginata]|uniref:Nucleolar protein 11-like n=1 Tax=Elysia marginata TaxID=1093978 RepID=A0AAV4FNB3_9GAST|nr:nucleolar protein 11-like [Elysia marginata]